MQARVKLIEGVAWLATADSGHGLVIDGSPEIGGQNRGPRPMELVLQGLAGCTGMDVVNILRRARQPVRDCEIVVTAERASTVPQVFTTIHVHYVVSGADLDEARVAHAVKLSSETYCSVSRMLQPGVTITYDFELRP